MRGVSAVQGGALSEITEEPEHESVMMDELQQSEMNEMEVMSYDDANIDPQHLGCEALFDRLYEPNVLPIGHQTIAAVLEAEDYPEALAWQFENVDGYRGDESYLDKIYVM